MALEPVAGSDRYSGGGLPQHFTCRQVEGPHPAVEAGAESQLRGDRGGGGESVVERAPILFFQWLAATGADLGQAHQRPVFVGEIAAAADRVLPLQGAAGNIQGIKPGPRL
ncbi:MAG: hypothetical protein U5K56_07290 [Halioglobus sp.]|nr:hypothetical protein [Halioglobus sp.]